MAKYFKKEQTSVVWQDHILDLETLIKENLDEINQHVINAADSTKITDLEVLDDFSEEIIEIDNKISELKLTQNHISA